MELPKEIPRSPGIYTVILVIKRDLAISVGSIGRRYFNKGVYVYVGSAMGPGGLRARIERHLRRDKKIKWHIDYLTTNPNVLIASVVYSKTSNRDYESLLANKLLESLEPAIKGFGSSDRRDYTHLFKCSDVQTCIDIVSDAMKNLGLNPVAILIR